MCVFVCTCALQPAPRPKTRPPSPCTTHDAEPQHNRPATFKYPLLSLAADFKMFAAIVTGRELLRLGGGGGGGE